MKKLLLALTVLLPGCISGPSYLSNSVRDTRNKSYVESPVGTAIITDIIPIYPIVEFFAAIPDVLVINPVQFWGYDIWSERGTGFRHKNPLDTGSSWIESLVSQVSPDGASAMTPVALPASSAK
jgi:hypothetical protein